MDWQTPIALLCVLLAGSFVSRRMLRTWQGTSRGCGTSCGDCSAHKASEDSQPLVTLNIPQPRSQQEE